MIEQIEWIACAERHGIDGPALVAKLRALTYPQEVALVDAVEQYWRTVAADSGA